MRILVLNDDLTGSPANIASLLNQGFEQMGHEITMFTSHRITENPETLRQAQGQAPWRLISLPISYRESLRHYRSLYSPSVSAMLHKEISILRPDIVHAHNIHHYLTYDALRIARKNGAKVFIQMHDVFSFAFHRVNQNRFLNSNGQNARLTSLDHIRAAGLQYNPFRNTWIRNVLHKNTAKIIAVSSALERALRQNRITNIEIIRNGIDALSWTHDESASQSFKTAHHLHGRKVILFGGRISLDKGTTPLLHAMLRLRERIPNVLLLVVGDQKRWDACVKAAGIREDLRGIVHCTGWLNANDMKTAYFASDVVATPSLCLDCFPQTNLEAMAAGKPVIGTIFGGTPEAVQNGVTGFVIDPRNTDLFTEKLRLLLSDDALRKRMGDAGRKRVEEEFSLVRQAERYLELFENELI